MPRKRSAGTPRSPNVRARAAAAGGAFALALALVGGVAYQTRSEDATGVAIAATDTTPPVDETAPGEESEELGSDETVVVDETILPDDTAAAEEEGEVSIGLDPTTSTAVADTTPAAGASTTTLAGTVAAGATTTTTPAAAAGGCPNAYGTSARVVAFTAPPPTCIDPTATYTARVETSKGTMTFALDTAKAPVTVNNFVYLARHHFYDGLVFHRIVPKFVLQTGDPTEVGDGGPGYTIPDELPVAGQYKVGSLAMASAGPNTGGSQFFIISGSDGVAIDPNYTLFGQLTSGLDVVRAIDGAGAPDPDPPLERVTISKIRS